jgi:hypothetical protein
MSNTVPAYVPPQFRAEPKLSAVPTQPSAKNRETLPAPAPRTWTFIDRTTDKLQRVTCMPGCVVDHSADQETPTHPHDIVCMILSSNLVLPLTSADEPEECRVLGVDLRQVPFSRYMHERTPHAVVEVIEDNHIVGLDPDGLAAIILQLEGQLQQMRAMHAQLSAIREQGRVEL